MLGVLEHGKPNRKVLIETPTDTVAASGQVTKVWATYRSVWCARFYNKGFDVERSDRFEVATNYKYKFTGWDSSITTSMRINDGGRYYYIHNIEPLGVGANIGTILYVDGRDHNENTK